MRKGGKAPFDVLWVVLSETGGDPASCALQCFLLFGLLGWDLPGVAQHAKASQAWKYEKKKPKTTKFPISGWAPQKRRFFPVFFIFSGLRGFCILYHPREISTLGWSCDTQV